MLQCERARLDRWDPKQKALRDREEHMLAMYRPRWVPSLTANVEWVRGFIERIRVGYPFDRTAIAALFEAAPLARTLEISPETGYSDMPPEAFEQLELGQFTGLFLRGFRWDEVRVRQVVEDGRLAAVDRLGLSGCSLGGGDLKALELRRFRELDLSTNALGVRGVQHALASASTLVELDLTNAGVNDHAVILVAEARLPKLERLWLRSNQLDEASLSRLGSRLPRLQVLDLAHNDPGQLGVEALGHASLPALRELDLSNCALTDDMVIALAASPLIEQLAWLDLGHNEIGPAAARALASVELPALRFLDLSSTAMGDEVALVKHAHPHARLVARAR